MRRKLLLTVALAVLGTAITAGVVNAQQASSGSGHTVCRGGQDLPPVSSHPACSDLKDNDGDGLTDLSDPGCSGTLDTDESDTAPPPPPPAPTPRPRRRRHRRRWRHRRRHRRRQRRRRRAATPAAAAEPDRPAGRIGRPRSPRRRDQRQRRHVGRLRSAGTPVTPPADPQAQRRPDEGQPHPHRRRLRARAARRPELPDRPVLDPALPAPHLSGLRHPVRNPLGGAGGHQPDRDRLRHQPQRLDGGRGRLDAVHPLHLEDVRSGRKRRRPKGSVQPGRRDLRRGALPEGGGRRQRPADRDLRLQPRGLVRGRGAALRRPVRQASRRPGRLAHRPDPGRPLPGCRQRPLRRRPLRARRRRSAPSRARGRRATSPTSSPAHLHVEG